MPQHCPLGNDVPAWLETTLLASRGWNKYKKLGMRKVELYFPDYLKKNLPFQRRKVLATVIFGLGHREDKEKFYY